MEKQKGSGLITLKVEKSTKESGKMTCKKDKESKFGRADRSMKGLI